MGKENKSISFGEAKISVVLYLNQRKKMSSLHHFHMGR